MSKYLPLIIIVLVLIGAGAYIMSMNQKSEAPITTTPTVMEEETVPSGVMAPKEFVVNGSNFSFDVKTITVKKGDTVRIVFKNQDGFHDFVIDDFNVATKQIQAGQEETVEFVADKGGIFEYYCSVGNHRAMGMVGTLTVEE